MLNIPSKANTEPRSTPHNQHHPGVDTTLATSPLATRNALDNASLPYILSLTQVIYKRHTKINIHNMNYKYTSKNG